MHIVISKVLIGIVVWQLSGVFLIHYLQVHLFTE